MIRTFRTPKGKTSKLLAGTMAVLIVSVGGHEGLKLTSYYDPVGIPTVCFGETKNIRMGMKFTRAECEGMLVERLVEHERGMDRCLKNPDALPQMTRAAFTSFTYNVGVGAFCGSSVARRANAGDLRGACDALLMWTKGTVAGVKRTLPGLVTRRKDERAMCLKGAA